MTKNCIRIITKHFEFIPLRIFLYYYILQLIKLLNCCSVCYNQFAVINLYYSVHFTLQISSHLDFFLLNYIKTGNPFRLSTDFLWFKITDISLISLSMRNYLLRKHIKISWQFINFCANNISNIYSRFWCSPVEII